MFPFHSSKRRMYVYERRRSSCNRPAIRVYTVEQTRVEKSGDRCEYPIIGWLLVPPEFEFCSPRRALGLAVRSRLLRDATELWHMIHERDHVIRDKELVDNFDYLNFDQSEFNFISSATTSSVTDSGHYSPNYVQVGILMSHSLPYVVHWCQLHDFVSTDENTFNRETRECLYETPAPQRLGKRIHQSVTNLRTHPKRRRLSAPASALELLRDVNFVTDSDTSRGPSSATVSCISTQVLHI